MILAARRAALALALAAAAPLRAAASAPPAPPPFVPPSFVPPPRCEETSGVRPVALRTTFGGQLLDFRYRVVDAEKAREIFQRKDVPRLLDLATGAVLEVPTGGKLGALRASLRNPPVEGKQYYMLFRNPGAAVGKGRKVAVVVGDCVFPDLVVR